MERDSVEQLFDRLVEATEELLSEIRSLKVALLAAYDVDPKSEACRRAAEEARELLSGILKL